MHSKLYLDVKLLWHTVNFLMAVDGIPIVYIDLGCPYVQVHQARLLLELEYPGVDLTKDAPDGLLSAAEIVWIESAKQVTISDFHRDVSTTLHAMSVECAHPAPPSLH